MAEFNSKKSKTVVCLLIILTSVIISFSLLHSAKAETTIISINPTSGNVGTLVQLNGNISTPNGCYIVKFDEIEITRGNATEPVSYTHLTLPTKA